MKKTLLLLALSASAFAQSPRDAATEIAATFGARFDIPCRVVAEDGAPVAGASVGWIAGTRFERTYGPAGRGRTSFSCDPEAVAGADGVARLSGVSHGEGGWRGLPRSVFGGVRAPALLVTATGFHAAVLPFSLLSPTGGIWRVAPAEGEPADALEARLRAIRAPRPMVCSDLPACSRLRGGTVGFDAAAGEFLPPLGAGRTADFFVRAAQTPATADGRTYSWLEFAPAPGGALLRVPALPDELRTPREAPEEGWSEAPVRLVDGRGDAARDAILFRSPRADGTHAGAIVPPLTFLGAVVESPWTVRFNCAPGDAGLEPEPVEPRTGPAEPAGVAEAAPSADPPAAFPLRVAPVRFRRPLPPAAPTISQTPRPPMPEDAAAAEPPPPPVWELQTSGGSLRKRAATRAPDDLPTNTCFTAAELARMFDPDDPALSSPDPFMRAAALDWHDRFGEAWALLEREAARPDADPALLLLAANYRLYGRPGVPALLDPDRPGFYRASLQAEARETLRRLVALAEPTNAGPRELWFAARARALLAPETFEEDSTLRSDVEAMLRRAKEAPIPSDAPDAAARRFFRELADEALRRHDAFCAPGTPTDDPGFRPAAPASAWARPPEGVPGGGTPPWEYGPVRSAGPGAPCEWPQLCRRRDAVFARRGADAMATLAALFFGRDTLAREYNHATLAVDPAWGEWWARRAAIRGNAGARAAFDGDRLADPEALPEPSAGNVGRWRDGGWHPRSSFPGAPGMGAGGAIEEYEGTPALAEDCARYGLRPFWFRRDLPPEGTPLGDDIRRLNARAEAGEEGSGGLHANNALPARLPFLLYLPDPAACTGAVPLVVYLPGNGEQGTDLAKQFRQTACIRRVTSPAFQAAHPAALLVPMPPDWGNHNISDGWPRDPFGPQAELFSDLALAVARSARALGGPAVDPARIHLTGLGSGGAIAAGMAFDHPGRFASVSGAWFFPYCDPNPALPGAWWIAQEDRNLDEDEALDWKERFEKRYRPFFDKVRALGGSAEYREYEPLPGAWWWDRMWDGDDAFWDWMFAQASDGEIDPEGAPIPRFLAEGAEPDSHAEAAEGAEPESHAEFAEGGGGSGEAEPPPVEPPAGEALVAAFAADGTAVFFGAEADGAFAPPAFLNAVRFRPGEAGATPLAAARLLVFADGVREIPEGALAGLPALACAVLPRELRSIGSRAFADCPALANVVFRGWQPVKIAGDAFARAGGARPDAWLANVTDDPPEEPARADGPFARVFGLRGRAPAAADTRVWARPTEAPCYLGPRVSDGRVWARRENGTGRVLAVLRPGAAAPAQIDGVPIREDDRPAGVPADFREERTEGPFSWTVGEDGAATLRRCTATNDVVSLPAALGGAPLRRVEPGAFRETAARGIRVPAGVKELQVHFDRAYPDAAPRAFWFDSPRFTPSLWGANGAYAAFAPADGEPVYRTSTRRLPADVDVEWLLARGTNGPPREAGFEYAKAAGADEAVVTGLAAPPDDGALAIPAALGGLPVAEIGDYAFAVDFSTAARNAFFGDPIRRHSHGNRFPPPLDRPVSLAVPDGVRRIGTGAFAGFGPLASVRLPDTLGSIGADAFSDCAKLEALDLPAGVREIPAGAFKGCRALRRVRAPGVRAIEPFAFADCPALERVETADGCAIDADAFADSPKAAARAESAEREPGAETSEPPEGDSPAPPGPSTRQTPPATPAGAVFGRLAVANLAVVDKDGAPLPGAWVEWRFPAPADGCVFSFDGLSRADAKGSLRVVGPSFGAFEAGVVNPDTGRNGGLERIDAGPDGSFSGTIRFDPGAEEDDAPVPAWRNGELRPGVPAGYDAAMHDFLPPFGTGRHADAMLTLRRFEPTDSGLGLTCIEVEAGGKTNLFLRQLPPWGHGRRRRVGHLLPPPCSWSTTNEAGVVRLFERAGAPWLELADKTPLRVALPPRAEGGEPGWLELRPGARDIGDIRISAFLPEETPRLFLPSVRAGDAGKADCAEGPWVAVGKTSDGAALFLGLFDRPSGVPPEWTARFASVSTFVPGSGRFTDTGLGVDTLVLMDGVGTNAVPAGAFAGWTDLRCVVALGGAPRIEEGAFAGCTNLAAFVRSAAAAQTEGAFAGCAPDFEVTDGIDLDGFPAWSYDRSGRLVYDGPRVLDGFVWRVWEHDWDSAPKDSRRGADRIGVLEPLPGRTNEWVRVPERVAGRPVALFRDAGRLPPAVRTIELPPGVVEAAFWKAAPAVVRTAAPETRLVFHGAEPELLFLPPGFYWDSPHGVNVGRTRLLPAGADLAAQLAVKWQNRDCGGWLWSPLGDGAAHLVGWRGADPTNGVLALPAFVGPEDRRGDVPSADAPPAGARRVVAVSDFMFRRHDATSQRERGARFGLVVPEGVETIGAFAFENTLRIEAVRLPATLRELGDGAFSNCGNLKEIDLPENVKEIPAGCFLGCASLERVSAPGATAVDALAFAGCERLVSLSLAPGAALHPAALLDTPGLAEGPHAEERQ